MQRGFSLIEAIVATALLATAVVALAQLLAMAVHTRATALATTTATLIAAQKMEELRAQSWSELAAAREGTDYFDAIGAPACSGAGGACSDAAYVRRWSAVADPLSSGVLIVQVHAAPVRNGRATATLVTARARMTP